MSVQAVAFKRGDFFFLFPMLWEEGQTSCGLMREHDVILVTPAERGIALSDGAAWARRAWLQISEVTIKLVSRIVQ